MIVGLLAAHGWVAAGEVTPDMFALWIEPADTVEATPGSTVEFTIYLSSEAESVEGWQFGLCYDDSVVMIPKVDDGYTYLQDLEGTDTAELKEGNGPDQVFIQEPAEGGGITVGVMIDFGAQEASLGVTERFSILKVPFEVVGVPGDMVEITICSTLGGDNPVNHVVSSGGFSYIPASIAGAGLKVRVIEPTIEIAGPEVQICANESDEAEVGVQLGLPADAVEGIELGGWSYGIMHSADELALTDIRSSELVAGLNAGDGPSFVGYNLDPAGGVGGTVGVVVDLEGPEFSSIPVEPGETVHTETFVYVSAMKLQEGEDPVVSDVEVVDNLLGAPLVPAAATVMLQPSPDSPVSLEDITFDMKQKTASITLKSCVVEEPLLEFVRGDANNDAVVNIADGVWILSYLFRGGLAPVCLDAADVDDSGMLDINDAISVIYYRLMGGQAPKAPFPECGTDPDDGTDRNNPADGITCMQTGAACP